jgi:hypothetical protein
VRRGQQHGPGARNLADRVDHGAVVVDRDRPGRQALRGDDVTVVLMPVPLHGHGGSAGRGQDPGEQRQGLGEPRADHDLVRRRPHPARPGQVGRQLRAKLGPTARVAVAERRRRCGRHRAAGRRQPGGARELAQVGQPGPQVITRRRLLPPGHGGRRAGRRDVLGDLGSRALPGGQPALGDQLAVGVGDRVARDAQIGGQRAGGRQPCPGGQPAGLHRLPQGGLERGPYPRPGQFQVQVKPGGRRRGRGVSPARADVGGGIGPGISHVDGPYSWA